jgi:hypothetical protein
MGDRPEADLALFGPHGRLTLYIDEPTWEDLDEAKPDYREDSGIIHLDALDILRDPQQVLQALAER